jgi:hypothetical protein
MKKCCLAVWFCLILSAAAAAQAPLSVGYQKTVQIAVPGATAAYSLDSSIVEASASAGTVEIAGKQPGTTNIIIVTSAGVQSLPVVVPAPRPALPPGFEPAVKEGHAAEQGSYEIRYNSNPGQITNSLMMQRNEGPSFERLQLVNANLFSAHSSESTVGFPLMSYEISHPNWGVVLADQLVDNSPLTVDRYLVRGFHLREGDWQFHGGFTTIATFQGLFLVTDPEKTLGVSRTVHVGEQTTLTGNLYYFHNPSNQPAAPNGVVGSLVHRIKRGDKLSWLTELGASRGLGFATRGLFDDKKNHLTANFRVEPQRFASLAVNNQHGVFADVNLNREFTQRTYVTAGLTQSNYNLPLLNQKNFTTNASLNYKVSSHVIVSGGSALSHFSSTVPAAASIDTLNLPVGVDYSARHWGTGFQYQRTINFGGAGGNDYAVNARAGWGKFQANGFFRHDVQVPTLSAIFAQLPGLQDLLERAGIVVTSPDQLVQLLRDTALLASLGFAGPFSVNVAPARNDTGASVTWASSGRSRQQITASYFNSDTQLLQGKLGLSTATLSYSRRLGNHDSLIASASMFRTVSNGTATVQPLVGISLQHRFFSIPAFIMPGSHGVIQGHVFRDDEVAVLYGRWQPGIAGVEVRLDDERVTHTDSKGYYSFHHVPFGAHRVEARVKSDEPFFYTSESPVTVDMNATADFGVNFAKGQIYGFLLNDAGKGVAGVTVELHGAASPRTVQTNAEGKFIFPGLAAGAYSISTVPASYPQGYSLQNLPASQATVTPGSPTKVEMQVRAVRVISGKVTVYDRKALKPVPLAGAIVRLTDLSLEARTGNDGAYIFRNLPAGTHTLAVNWLGKEVLRTVTVPADPANIRDVDIDAGPK